MSFQNYTLFDLLNIHFIGLDNFVNVVTSPDFPRVALNSFYWVVCSLFFQLLFGLMLALLMRLRREHRMAVLLITHDLAVVAETADRVVVMYAGQVMETGPVPGLFDAPRHPYTHALLEALPEHNFDRARLKTIPGVVPGAFDRPSGCLLAPRCEFATERCVVERPRLAGDAARAVRCHFPL